MKLLIFASAGGAIGAGLRYLVNQAYAAAGATEVARGVVVFPWATLTVNVLGSFLMGVVFVVIGERLGGSPEARAFLATGILGGFTTFSAFSLDVLNLMTAHNGIGLRVAAYVCGSVLLSVLALMAGIWLTRSGLSA